jgi:nicotinamide-nucleotide amidase
MRGTRTEDGHPVTKAGILAVGSELLTPYRSDTNSLFLTARLNEVGIEVCFKGVVGDRVDEVATAVAALVARLDVVLVTGGLGPTSDDVTREGVARALGLPLEEDPQLVEQIRGRFDARGIPMPEVNRRQAMVPRGAEPIANPHGTAPGLWIERDRRLVVLLPGPPRELEPMVVTHVVPRLRGRVGDGALLRRVVKIVGRTESQIEEALQPLYARWRQLSPPIEVTILAALGQIELHLAARQTRNREAAAVLGAAIEEVCRLLGPDVFTTDDRRLEEVVGALLTARGARIAVAESCTGGLIASRLTDVPGSSAYLERGVVAYSDAAKVDLLGVPEALIAAHGAVSEPVAEAMATGVRARAGVDWGLGVTGIAGPTGGTPAKPVGTVVVAVAGPTGVGARRYRFRGERDQVKAQASQAALDLLRRMLLGL